VDFSENRNNGCLFLTLMGGVAMPSVHLREFAFFARSSVLLAFMCDPSFFAPPQRGLC
jgi:hypothetical protein